MNEFVKIKKINKRLLEKLIQNINKSFFINSTKISIKGGSINLLGEDFYDIYADEKIVATFSNNQFYGIKHMVESGFDFNILINIIDEKIEEENRKKAEEYKKLSVKLKEEIKAEIVKTNEIPAI